MQILKKGRIFAVCLAAMLASTGSMAVFADTQESAAVQQEDAETDTGSRVSLAEAVEEPEVTAETAKQYMQSLGTQDGCAVFLRRKEYKKDIKAEFAAQVGKLYSDEDAAEDAADVVLDQLRHAELVLLDEGTGKVLAACEEIADAAYLSEAGRYFVRLNDALTRVEAVRFRVSTLDSPYLFLSKDKKTLELYTQDYAQVQAVMQLVQKDAQQCLYRSSDGWQAFLSAQQDEAWACVRQVAKNDALALYADSYTGVIALENLENGYIWWSTPLGANRDRNATPLLSAQLQSSLMVQYGDTNSLSTTNVRSHGGAQLKVKELTDGVEIRYTFEDSGITVPVRYTLGDAYLEASVECADIVETQLEKGRSLTELTVLGSFGAGAADEEGYFVLPDGCGALVEFNNGKTDAAAYRQPFYGRDITAILSRKPALTENLLMPVYGIVKQDNALAVVITQGDGSAMLNASVSEQSMSSYNFCYPSFVLRGTDTYLMAGSSGGKVTVFEDGAIKTDRVSLRYYPIAEKNADYMDIAEIYRGYLTEDAGVSAKAQPDTTTLCLDLYGGTMKKRSILGIPVTMKTSMTSFAQAQEIISGFAEYGVEDMAVVYHNWTNDGISGKVDDSAKPAGILGGSGAFGTLTDYMEEQGFSLYPAVNNKEFRSGGGYHVFTDTAIRISGSYSRQIRYNLAYGVQDMSASTRSLLSPAVFGELYRTLAQRSSSRGLTGICLGEMTSTLYGDYGKAEMSREDTKTALLSSYQELTGAGLSLYADACAAYAFPHASRIGDVPLQSSGFDLFDGDIPFYQIVLHGLIPYSSTPINGSADSDAAFLLAIAAGCDPAYDMIYADASDLKDTQLDTYFYSHYAYWQEQAAKQYQLAAELLSAVSDQQIVEYQRDGDCSVTQYADGTTITVDYETETITMDGREYRLSDLTDEKGT